MSASPPAVQTQARAAGVYPAMEKVLEIFKQIEADLAERLPDDWLAAHGPCAPNLKKGMEDMHMVFQSFQAVVKSGKTDLDHVAAACMALSAQALKLGVDVNAVLVRRDRLEREGPEDE